MREAALLLAVAGAAAAQDLAAVFFSPKPYQVFQRQTATTGVIPVKGVASILCDAVEARVADGPWIPVPYGPGQRFDGPVQAHAGGLYEVEVRLLLAGKTVATTTIPNVGIGEVFVIAGQSNATNYGEERQQSKSRMVVAFDGDRWRIADDPQPGVQDNSHNGSFIPAFGDALYEKLHVPIGVACVGHGSTSVRQWLPKGERFRTQPTMMKFVAPAGDEWQSTGELFDRMLERIRQLGSYGFRALLWHQGESDAHQKEGHEISGAEYRALLERVIRESRAQAGWEFPWFVAEASYHTPDDPSSGEIRDAQRAIWRLGLALQGPDTDTLTGLYRQNDGRGVHFSAAGLQAHGRLWAEKVAAYVEKQ